MSEGHLLVIVINLPKVPLDQPLMSAATYIAQLPPINELMTFQVFLPYILAIIASQVVVSFLVTLGFYCVLKKIQKTDNDLNTALINESKSETDPNEKIPLTEKKG